MPMPKKHITYGCIHKHPLLENFVTIYLEYLQIFSFLDDIDALYLKQGSHLCSQNNKNKYTFVFNCKIVFVSGGQWKAIAAERLGYELYSKH